MYKILRKLRHLWLALRQTIVVEQDCNNCGFLRQLWLVLRQLWSIATIVNIATIVITSWCNIEGHVYKELKKIALNRGHSRKQPKGGRNSHKRYTSTCFADHFSQFLLTKSTEAFSKNFTTCILYIIRLIHRVRLVWGHDILVKKFVLYRSKGGLATTATYSWNGPC